MTEEIELSWKKLSDELKKWEGINRTPIFWLRDDDITKGNSNIFRLINLCESNDTSLYLAAIPAEIDLKLVNKIKDYSKVYFFQHGYTHRNHSPGKISKSEFSSIREIDTMNSEIQKGFKILSDCCGEKFLPVFVPPWNRMTEKLFPFLPKLGLKAYSGKKTSFTKIKEIFIRDAHVDIINWKNNRKFIGEIIAIKEIVNQLVSTRKNQSVTTMPTCILTHHKVMGDDSFLFLETLIKKSKELGAIWGSPEEIFGDGF